MTQLSQSTCSSGKGHMFINGNPCSYCGEVFLPITRGPTPKDTIESLLSIYRHSDVGPKRQSAHDAIVSAYCQLGKTDPAIEEKDQLLLEARDALCDLTSEWGGRIQLASKITKHLQETK